MQRVFAARFSGDGAYVFSGSDDMNVRVWKVRPVQLMLVAWLPVEGLEEPCVRKTFCPDGRPLLDM